MFAREKGDGLNLSFFWSCSFTRIGLDPSLGRMAHHIPFPSFQVLCPRSLIAASMKSLPQSWKVQALTICALKARILNSIIRWIFFCFFTLLHLDLEDTISVWSNSKGYVIILNQKTDIFYTIFLQESLLAADSADAPEHNSANGRVCHVSRVEFLYMIIIVFCRCWSCNFLSIRSCFYCLTWKGIKHYTNKLLCRTRLHFIVHRMC